MSNIHEVNVANENLYLELWQYDAGQVLKFVETTIPDGSHVLFANSETRKAIRKEVASNQVGIPNKFLRATGKLHITIETFNENEETTLYEINGYIKRRQDGEPGTAPDDEPTFIQKIIQTLNELKDKVENWFYTKSEVDDKDTLTLDTAKNYTDEVAEDLDRDINGLSDRLDDAEDEIESKVPLTRKLGEDLTLNIDIDGYRFAGALVDALVDDSGSQFSKFINRLKDFFYAEDEIDQELSSLGNSLSVSIDPLTYVCTFRLMHNSHVISVSSIDLPLETMVLDVDYDSQTKELVITLENGTVRRVDVAAIVSGLVNTETFNQAVSDLQDAIAAKQDKIGPNNKVSADNVDDTSSTNKFTTQAEKQGWNAKEDPTNIEKDSTSTTVSLTLENNTENRYTEDLTDLTIALPQTIDDDFISGVVFASGTIPTAMTYDSSIKWTGDDVNNNVFVPAADKTYNFIIWNDGININAIVRGVA